MVKKAERKEGDDDEGHEAELSDNEDIGVHDGDNKTRGRWERLGCGDVDVTIWGGVNGVGSEAIEEQSGRGVER